MAQIVWFTNGQELMVQFKNIGEYTYFKTVLGRFEGVGKTRWVYEKHSWKLPVEDFPKLVRFADRESISLIWAGQDEQPRTLPLF